jgi:hypothetical protein
MVEDVAHGVRPSGEMRRKMKIEKGVRWVRARALK